MEAGKGAESWLGGQLAADPRWSDGVPADVEPWVADAFADIVTMTIDELAAAADAPELTADDMSSEILADAAHETVARRASQLDEWLGGHDGFVTAHDDETFTISERDIADLSDDWLDDRHTAPTAGEAPSSTNSSGLIDAFDGPMAPASASLAETDVDGDDLRDDILRSPNIDDTGDVAIVEQSGDDLATEPMGDDLSAPATFAIVDSPSPGADADDASALLHDLTTDDVLIGDLFDAGDFDAIGIDAGDDGPGIAAEPGDDLLDEFGDDTWNDD